MNNRGKRLLEMTTNRSLYNKLIKKYREDQGEIGCSFCPYHKFENIKSNTWNHRSWKKHRDTQYRVKRSRRSKAKMAGSSLPPRLTTLQKLAKRIGELIKVLWK